LLETEETLALHDPSSPNKAAEDISHSKHLEAETVDYHIRQIVDYLFCADAGIIAGVELHDVVALLKFVLDKLGTHAVAAAATRKGVEEAADHAHHALLLLLLVPFLALLPLDLQHPPKSM
jgi:hypothetical protein